VTATGEPRLNGGAGTTPFDDFYRAELDRQVRRAYLLTGSAELADDIVHDAMVAMYRRWDAIDEPAAYLNRAVLNGCRDAGRRAVRQRLTVIVERASDPNRPPATVAPGELPVTPGPTRRSARWPTCSCATARP
jgi:DNA-directed RNA polymerase specialized sigma24 family protein